MRKFLVVTTPIVSLIVFILIMLSSSIFKNSSINGNTIPELIQLITEDIKSENWEDANDKTEILSNTWDKIVKRIQYSSERDEINSFHTSLARLRGAIMAEDKSSSFSNLEEAYDHWNGLGK